jgi:hypothetical protein
MAVLTTNADVLAVAKPRGLLGRQGLHPRNIRAKPARYQRADSEIGAPAALAALPMSSAKRPSLQKPDTRAR